MMLQKSSSLNLGELVSRTRRNHALEHASIHILSSKNPEAPLIGRSDSRGFFLYTDLPKAVVESGVQQALQRLRAGEHRLAIHPNCGTNLMTAGLLSGIATLASIQGTGDREKRDWLQRLPLAIMSATLGILLARPLGVRIQRYLTTDAEPGELEIVSVNRVRSGRGNLYRILTRN
jgi:hypothetical protein